MEDQTENQEDTTENDTVGDPLPQRAQNQPATKKRSLPSPHEVIGEHAASMESTRVQQQQQQQQQKSDKVNATGADIPTTKRSRATAVAAAVPESHRYAAEHSQLTYRSEGDGGGETPPMKTPETERSY